MSEWQMGGGQCKRAVLGAMAWGLAGCAVLAPQGGATPANLFASELAQPECRSLTDQRARLQRVHAGLAREGLALRVLGCPMQPSAAPGHALVPAIAVAVVVLDGRRAAHHVRGPLADGEPLDIGEDGAAAPGEGLSPDVHFNRAWLRATMDSGGFLPVQRRWAVFVPR